MLKPRGRVRRKGGICTGSWRTVTLKDIREVTIRDEPRGDCVLSVLERNHVHFTHVRNNA